MPIFDNYPRADLHEMNLDWLLKTMKSLIKEVEDLKNKQGTDTGHIEEQITNIDNSMIIINENIQNLYNIVGMFLDTVNVTNARRKAVPDTFELVEIQNI